MVGLKVGVLYSGGKDSTYAAYAVKLQGHSLVCLITILPENPESYLFHYPNAGWTHLQAEAIGIPVVKVGTDKTGVNEVKDLLKAVETAKHLYHIEGVVTGGLASKYQKDRFEMVCVEAGLKHLSPLWQKDPETYLRSVIEAGFKVMVVGVYAEGLGEDWLGRILDEDMLAELKDLNRRLDIHIAFEGGEAETFVLDCPLFKRRIEVLDVQRHWHGDHGFLEIKDAKLVEKTGLQKS